MKRLIVNSDDYGRSAGISRGIREAHLHGIVSSTTCMMNFPTAVEDVQLARKETTHLGMGVHLVLTSGRPLLPPENIPSLVTPEGEFHKLLAFTEKRLAIDPWQAKAEWRAQVETFIAATGRRPTHLDAHHHSAYFTAGLFRCMLELAQENECALRLPAPDLSKGRTDGLPEEVALEFVEFAPGLIAEFQPVTPDDFISTFYDETATLENLLHIIKTLPEGTNELMCHVGYADEELAATSTYNYHRNRELAILTDPLVRQALAQHRVELIHFGNL